MKLLIKTFCHFIKNKSKRKYVYHLLTNRTSLPYGYGNTGGMPPVIQNINFDLYHRMLIIERKNNPLNYEELFKQEKKSLNYLYESKEHNYLNLYLNIKEYSFDEQENNVIHPFYFLWEIRPHNRNIETMLLAEKYGKPLIFVGDAFLRSADTTAHNTVDDKYIKGISFTFDDLTSYFDASKPSRLEMLINDKNFIISEAQKARARECIDKIISTHLTKYNHQPIITPNIGRKGVKKVLVVDQTYNDMSIAKGWGTDETFKIMLQKAIDENPDADIIIKTHPDTIVGRGGYYTDIKEHNNIYRQTTPINPISLIKYVDKVYVCSTQFGFEALMCNKETHVFGMPFYAGWGLTIDEQKCPRRTNKRSLEEIFYLAYIVYSKYVNPETGKKCEIEEAMDYLLSLRKEYFEKYNILSEI